MRVFRRLARFVALVLSVVLANLALAGSGSACASATAMPSPMRGPSSPHHATAPAASHETAPAPAPCHLPMAPSGCAGMATCATIALPAAPTAAAAAPPATVQVIDRTVALAPGDTRAPELPPPRA